MRTIQLLLQDRTYSIRIAPGGLNEVGAAIRKECSVDHAVVLTTRRVARQHYAALEDALTRVGLEADCIEVPDGERGKTLRTVSRVYDQLVALGVDRSTPVIAFGGGALCDLAGFVASTYLRGLPVVQIPTTLRAQVDVSVGGKTAVHHGGARNLIGTFHPPRLVWVDPHLLRSLPVHELGVGLAEIVKVAAVWDAEFYEWLESKTAGLLSLDLDSMTEAITRAIQIRTEIVGLDERSAGLRALLLFGERFAEVVRRLRPELGSGEATAMGMYFSAQLSCRRGWLEAAQCERLGRLLQKIGLPTTPPDWSEQKQAYLRGLADDKKHVRALPEWVLLRELGRAERTQVLLQELWAEGE